MTAIDLADVLVPTEDGGLHVRTLAAMSCQDFSARAPWAVKDPADPELRAHWRAFAERNRVGPVVAHAVLERDAGAPDQQEWRALHDAGVRRMAVMMSELDRIGTGMHEAGIDAVALKNGGIARALHHCAACVPMGDLDILVRRDRFVDAHHALLGLGYEVTSTAPTVAPPDIELGLARGGMEYVLHPGGEEVLIDLQWRPISWRWLAPDQEPDGDDYIARSRPVPGSDIRLLSASDNMIQVAVHTAKHSYMRAPGLRLHTDVDRLVTYDPPDWDEVIDQARALRVTTMVYFSLALAQALLLTPVPDEVLAALAPPRWKIALISRWLRWRRIFEPDEDKFANRVEALGFHVVLLDTPWRMFAPQRVRREVARLMDLVRRHE